MQGEQSASAKPAKAHSRWDQERGRYTCADGEGVFPERGQSGNGAKMHYCPENMVVYRKGKDALKAQTCASGTLYSRNTSHVV